VFNDYSHLHPPTSNPFLPRTIPVSSERHFGVVIRHFRPIVFPRARTNCPPGKIARKG